MNLTGFKRIRGYKHYWVNNSGQVYSEHINRIMKPVNNHGYVVYSLISKGEYKLFLAHRLVMLHFGGEPPEGKTHVNHKNGIRSDNRLENLEWCSQAENTLHSYRVLGRKHAMLGIKGSDNPSSKAILGIQMETWESVRFHSAADAEREGLGFKRSAISAACLGRIKAHGNYFWKYVDNTSQNDAILHFEQ